MKRSVKVLLRFDQSSASEPMIYYLAKDYDIVFSILQADIRPGEGGRTILELTGEEEDIRKGLEYASSRGVSVKTLTKAIVWDELSCVHCGTCTAVCTHQALSLDPVSATLSFNNENCIVCEMCVSACPTNSVRTDFA